MGITCSLVRRTLGPSQAIIVWARGGDGPLATRHLCLDSCFCPVAAAATRDFEKKTTIGCVGVCPSHYLFASVCCGPVTAAATQKE